MNLPTTQPYRVRKKRFIYATAAILLVIIAIEILIGGRVIPI